MVQLNEAVGSGNNVFYITQNNLDPSGNPVSPLLVVINISNGGWFDYDEMAAAIATALNAAGGTGTFTCTYQSQSGGFVLANATNDFFVLTPDHVARIPGISQGRVTCVARALTTLGLLNGAVSVIQPSVSGSAPSMLYTNYIDIVSRYLTKYMRAKDFTTLKNPTKTSILIRVFMTPPNTTSRPLQTLTADSAGAITVTTQSPFSQPFTICVDPNQPKFMAWSPDEAIANFDLQLLDTFGVELPIFEGTAGYGSQCEYQITLLASES
jgi:hypothetical protein